MIRIGLLVNPTAGRGRGAPLAALLERALRTPGTLVLDVGGPTAAAARASARSALPGLDALVVAGGDGTVRLGAEVVAGTPVPLGIVATGSGNDVARALGLPVRDLRAGVAAVRAALVSGPRVIDAFEVRGAAAPGSPAWCVGVLSAGLDAAVNARANTMRRPRGRARYVRALLAELPRFRPYGYRITIDGVPFDFPGTLVAVANGPAFGGGMRIAPHASFDDGALDVVLAGPVPRREVARIFPRVYSGGHLDHPAVRVLRGSEVRLEPLDRGSHAAPPPAFADGDGVGALPVTCTLRAGALRVLAPEPAR